MHLVDVLLGHSTERVRQLGHDQLSVFGIGAELNENQWRTVMRQLVALGHLQPDSDSFGALKLTASARDVLKGQSKVMLREETAISPTRKARAKVKSAKGGSAVSPRVPAPSYFPEPKGKKQQSGLVEILRTWRTRTAREQGVPAYVVLHDATLEGIAASLPKNLDQLRTVVGIGDKKLERYGEVLLTLVRSQIA